MLDSKRILTVRAPNPSLMTLEGTNSYITDCENGEAVCIDPGPAIERHVQALLDAARARNLRITLIAVTHNHPDHWPAAPMLARATGARIAMREFTSAPHDISLHDGDTVSLLQVMDAPGHTADHVVFYDPRERALFTGDVILGRGTVAIAPPGGSMRDYQRTLQRLLERFPDARTIYGGHGPVVTNAKGKIQEYIAHRQLREAELLEALAAGPQTVPQLVQRIYADVDRGLWPAAARQMLAYLLPLEQEGRISSSAISRPMTPEEAALLNPHWEELVGKEHVETVEAELGEMLHIDSVREYRSI
jgi:glyoxylase-like metal-dependent hydrolase (beta-lactamase superfamily II)